jgi:hypothetical protein
MIANLLPAAIGFTMFAVFVGYLALKIAALPMLIIVGLVLALCLFDFVQALRDG